MFSVENSTFIETRYFLSIQPTLDTRSFILIGYKIHPDDSTDYFISNWREVSGLGNMLLALSSTYSVKKVMFLHNENKVSKEQNMFQFLVMLEVSHKKEDLIYLLDYIQKAHSTGHIGFLSVYKEILIQGNRLNGQ